MIESEPENRIEFEQLFSLVLSQDFIEKMVENNPNQP
jgi:hypothetical protein